MSLLCFPNRSAILDQARTNGQEIIGRSCGQHRQIPLRCVWKPTTNHTLAEEWKRVQGRAENGRHQGESNNMLTPKG